MFLLGRVVVMRGCYRLKANPGNANVNHIVRPVHLLTIFLFRVQINETEGWLITDLRLSKTIFPSTDPTTGQALISTFDIPVDVDTFYWLSPSQYTGNKLAAYGSSLYFSISWVIMRGDSSGRQMLDPDVIIIVRHKRLGVHTLILAHSTIFTLFGVHKQPPL